MGVASYSEDILTRFLEATETMPIVISSLLPRHHCPFCPKTFEDRQSLSDHVYSQHHGDRPVLVIGGREPDQTSTIRQSLRREQIAVENCSAVRVRINGVWQNDTIPQTVPKLLSRETDALIDLELVNRFDGIAATG